MNDPKDVRPSSIFAPRASPEDDWRRLQKPNPPSQPPQRHWPVELVLIVVCGIVAVLAAGWSLTRAQDETTRIASAAPAVVTLVAISEGQSLQDVCAAYGLPSSLCDLSERCAAQAPRRDGRLALVLRSDGEDCGSPPP
jgi:hypothetical protein